MDLDGQPDGAVGENGAGAPVGASGAEAPPAIIGVADSADPLPYPLAIIDAADSADPLPYDPSTPRPLEPGMKPPKRIAGDWLGLHDVDCDARWPVLIVASGVVDTEGHFRDLKLLNPKKIDACIAGAFLDRLKTWKFSPADKDGEPVAVHYNMSMNICYR